MLSEPFLLRVRRRVASLRLVTVVLASVGKASPPHRPRVTRGQVSLPLVQLTPPGLLRVGVSQHTSTSLVSEQTIAVTGLVVPSEPTSTSNDVMETVSSESQFLPDLRQGPEDDLVGVGGLGGLFVTTLGLGAGVGDLGGEDGDFGGQERGLLLLSKIQVFLLIVSEAPTL